MSDLQRGSFNDVMEGLEDELDDVEIVPEGEEPEEETPAEPADEVKEEEEEEEKSETEEDTEEEESEDESTEEEQESDGDEEDTEEDDDDEPLTWTVKIDGKEQEIDEEELVRGYQTAKSSTKRFNEAKRLHQEAQTFWSRFVGDKSNPGEALTDYYTNQTGGDRVKARALVQEKFLEFLAPAIEEMNIEDERERELFRKKRELEEQEKELERRKQEAKSRQDKEAEEEFISDVRTNIDKQIKRLKLPADDVIWQQAGKYLAAAQDAGSTNDEILDLIPTVMRRIKDDRIQEAEARVSTLTDEEFERVYAEKLKKRDEKLKKKRVQTVKEKKQGKKNKADPDKPAAKKKGQRRKKPEFVNSTDAFNSIDLSEFED